METYERLAEQVLARMDEHRHIPPEPVSATIRGEMAVLRLLGQEKRSMNPGEVAQKLAMTTSRIAAVIKSLEKKAFIERRTDKDDRRRAMISLTEKGNAYLAERREEAKRHLICMLSSLGEEDAEAFVRLTGKIFEAKEKKRISEEVCHEE